MPTNLKLNNDYQLFGKSTTKTTLKSFVYRVKSSVSSTTTGLVWRPVSSTGNWISFTVVSPLLDTSAWRTCTNTIVVVLILSYMQLRKQQHYVAVQMTSTQAWHIRHVISGNTTSILHAEWPFTAAQTEQP